MAKNEQPNLQLATSNPEPEAGEKEREQAAMAAGVEVQQRLLATAAKLKGDSDDDHWRADNPDLIIPEQRATVVYANRFNAVVIRQEKTWDMDEDSFVYIHPQHIDALVEKLMEYKAYCEGEMEKARRS